MNTQQRRQWAAFPLITLAIALSLVPVVIKDYVGAQHELASAKAEWAQGEVQP